MGETTREGASGSVRRKSGDRPGARHWAFPAAQGEPESFLVVFGSECISFMEKLQGWWLVAIFHVPAICFHRNSIDPLLDARASNFRFCVRKKALQLHRSACVH
jgi:hypothetical protein